MSYKLSFYHEVSPAFVDQRTGLAFRIVFSTRTGELRVIDISTWDRLENGAFGDIPNDIIADLARIELLIPTGEDELRTILSQNRRAASTSPTCSLVIQPTAYCQFACDYCGQSHSSDVLDINKQEALLAMIRQKLSAGRSTHLEVYWFGAEPLAGIGIMRSLSPHLNLEATNAGCTYGAAIVTNGYTLTSEIVTELSTVHKIHTITVTLDGVAEFHDKRRILKSGRATFDRVFENLVNMARRRGLDLSFDIKVRCNVDRRNKDGVIPLIRKLAEAKIQDKVFFYCAPIHSWGNDAQSLSLPPSEYASLELSWFAEMYRLGFKLGLIPKRKPVVCVAVDSNADVVDAHGQLFNCTEVSYVPAYGMPNLWSTGHLDQANEKRSLNVLSGFHDDVAGAKFQCSTCRMYPVCGGACPKLWHEGHEPCPSAKRNIKGRLLLAYAENLRAEREVSKTIN